jgi:hypothetical protein
MPTEPLTLDDYEPSVEELEELGWNHAQGRPYDLECDHHIGPLDADAADLWAIERIEARGEEPTDEAIDAEVLAYAEDCRDEELAEECKWRRHERIVRRIRLTGGWRPSRHPRQPHRRVVRVRPRERRARRTARTAGSRGDPSEPDLATAARRAA